MHYKGLLITIIMAMAMMSCNNGDSFSQRNKYDNKMIKKSDFDSCVFMTTMNAFLSPEFTDLKTLKVNDLSDACRAVNKILHKKLQEPKETKSFSANSHVVAEDMLLPKDLIPMLCIRTHIVPLELNSDSKSICYEDPTLALIAACEFKRTGKSFLLPRIIAKDNVEQIIIDKKSGKFNIKDWFVMVKCSDEIDSIIALMTKENLSQLNQRLVKSSHGSKDGVIFYNVAMYADMSDRKK